jgi:hypothetical protein
MNEPSTGFQQMVMYRLDQIDGAIAELRTEVVGVRIDVATLKVKAGIWGAAAGTVPAIIGVIAVIFAGGPVGG